MYHPSVLHFNQFIGGKAWKKLSCKWKNCLEHVSVLPFLFVKRDKDTRNIFLSLTLNMTFQQSCWTWYTSSLNVTAEAYSCSIWRMEANVNLENSIDQRKWGCLSTSWTHSHWTKEKWWTLVKQISSWPYTDYKFICTFTLVVFKRATNLIGWTANFSPMSMAKRNDGSSSSLQNRRSSTSYRPSYSVKK